MIAAKLACPQSQVTDWNPSLLNHLAHPGSILIQSPPGALNPESLVFIIKHLGMDLLWLRLSAEERDPGALLLALLDGAQAYLPGLETNLQRKIKSFPGPVYGWPGLYQEVAATLTDVQNAPVMIVLEHLEELLPALGTWDYLLHSFIIPLLPQSTLILISHQPLPLVDLRSSWDALGPAELQLNKHTNPGLLMKVESTFSKKATQRLQALSAGREGMLRGILEACQMVSAAEIERAVHSARDGGDLLIRVARTLLAIAPAAGIQALGLTLKLGYSHPALLAAALGEAPLPTGPWLQWLDGQWMRVRCLWQPVLEKALGNKRTLERQVLLRAAQFLTEQDQIHSALQVFCDLGEYHQAAQLLDRNAGGMLDLGQWINLSHWLDRLPMPTLQAYTELVYLKGELAAAGGQVQEAQRFFNLSTLTCAGQKDQNGMCRGLLAQSSLAAWGGDTQRAIDLAQSVLSIANATGSTWFSTWAAWQLGGLSAMGGDMEDARLYFAAAAQKIPDSSLQSSFAQVEALAQRGHAIHQQVQRYQLALQKLQEDEGQISDLVKSLSTSPPRDLPLLLEGLGWSHTPLMVKLGLPYKPALKAPTRKQGWIQLVSAFFSTGLPPTWQNRPHRAKALPQALLNPRDHLNPAHRLPLPLVQAETDPFLVLSGNMPGKGESAAGALLIQEGEEPGVTQPDISLVDDQAPKSFLKLSASLLGDFQFALAGIAIERWPGNRSLLVLKYLLVHSRRKIPREILMDQFWPEAGPDAARNNLNVALYKLRQLFSTHSEQPVVLFEGGNYYLNPVLEISLDYEEFERHFQAARRLEQQGLAAEALGEFEAAVDLYHGDLLAEDVYEDWAVSGRERLRVLFLEALDRLSRIYFNQGNYPQSIALCLRILERDNCREDATCRLMRSYSRLGRHNLALRQYQACVEALRKELDVEPEELTRQLAAQIRHKESV